MHATPVRVSLHIERRRHDRRQRQHTHVNSCISKGQAWRQNIAASLPAFGKTLPQFASSGLGINQQSMSSRFRAKAAEFRKAEREDPARTSYGGPARRTAIRA